MHSIRQCFDTTLDKNQFIPVVFTTKLKLNERFTFTKPKYCFIISNGFTAPNFGVDVKERIVFNNRRSNSTSKKFTAYKEVEKSEIKSEDMKKLERELLQMAKHRRTVRSPPSPSSDLKRELSKEHSIKITERRITAISSPAHSISEVRTKSVCIQTENENVNSENTCYNDRERPFKRNWSGEVKNTQSFSYSRNGGFRSSYGSASYYSRNGENRGSYGSGYYYSKNDENKGSYDSCPTYSRNGEFKRSSYVSGSLYGRNYERSIGSRNETFTTSPFHYYGSDNQNQGMSLFKWRRGITPSKEELDEEIDRYMAEIKFKTPEAEAENIDAFVEEYMMETEKCIKEHELILLE